jgi:hypothetical protein
MPSSKIIITQTAHGSSAAGEAKRGLDLYAVLSQAITFTNDADASVGVTKYEWTLIERPPGSTATLSGAATATASLQADKYGGYVVSLRVNDMADNTDGYSVTVAGCSYPVLHTVSTVDYGDWDPPAFHEETNSNWIDKYGPKNPYGSQRGLYKILSDLREFYIPTALNASNIIRFPFVYIATYVEQEVDSAAYFDAAVMAEIDMTDYSYDTVKFVTVCRVDSPGTGYVRLYDETNGVAVTSSEVTTTSSTIVTLTSSALTVGGGAGNLRTTPAMYKVQVKITGGTPGVDYINIFDAYIDLDA